MHTQMKLNNLIKNSAARLQCNFIKFSEIQTCLYTIYESL